MSFLRYILLFVMGYYLLKVVWRFLFPGARKDNVTDPVDKKGKKVEYSKFTDQKIEDADYEDLED